MDLSPLNGPSIVWPGGREEIPPHANLHYPCIHNFVNAVLDGEPLRSTGASGLATAWVTEEVINGPGYIIASRSRTPNR